MVIWMRRVQHDFRTHDLVGGDLALDFVNTVTARDGEPSDWVDGYGALLGWAALTGAFAKKDLAALATMGGVEPARATAALARCRALREALCGVLYAMIAARAPTTDDLATIDEARLAATKAAKLVSVRGRVLPVWSVERSGLDLVAHVVGAHALALLQDPKLDRLRVCDGHDCGWVFIDTSKNGRRRWCDMATCGNTAKARRHYERQH
jgi:predicted RNA-binding Zn ribbon-like protein